MMVTRTKKRRLQSDPPLIASSSSTSSMGGPQKSRKMSKPLTTSGGLADANNNKQNQPCKHCASNRITQGVVRDDRFYRGNDHSRYIGRSVQSWMDMADGSECLAKGTVESIEFKKVGKRNGKKYFLVRWDPDLGVANELIHVSELKSMLIEDVAQCCSPMC